MVFLLQLKMRSPEVFGIILFRNRGTGMDKIERQLQLCIMVFTDGQL